MVYAVGQELLLDEMPLIVVGILIAFGIAELLHQLRGSVAKVQGHRLITRLLDEAKRLADSHICRIALWRGGKVNGSLGKRYARLRPANLMHRVESSIGKQQRVGIGKAYIL